MDRDVRPRRRAGRPGTADTDFHEHSHQRRKARAARKPDRRALVNANGRCVASIIDEGDGFAPEDEHRLFIPFWRAGADKRAGRPGSGIRLTLAAKMVEAHGGKITAKNRADRSGACFSVSIPAA